MQNVRKEKAVVTDTGVKTVVSHLLESISLMNELIIILKSVKM